MADNGPKHGCGVGPRVRGARNMVVRMLLLILKIIYFSIACVGLYIIWQCVKG